MSRGTVDAEDLTHRGCTRNDHEQGHEQTGRRLSPHHRFTILPPARARNRRTADEWEGGPREAGD